MDFCVCPEGDGIRYGSLRSFRLLFHGRYKRRIPVGICIFPTVAIFPLPEACIVNRVSSILLSSNQSILWADSKVCGKEPSSGCEFLLCLLHPKFLYLLVNCHTQPLAICLKFQLHFYYWYVWHLASATGKPKLPSLFTLEIPIFQILGYMMVM